MCEEKINRSDLKAKEKRGKEEKGKECCSAYVVGLRVRC